MRHNNLNTPSDLKWRKGRCSRVRCSKDSSAEEEAWALHWAPAQPAWLLAGSPATRWGAASTETAHLRHQHRSRSPSTSVGMIGWNEGTLRSTLHSLVPSQTGTNYHRPYYLLL